MESGIPLLIRAQTQMETKRNSKIPKRQTEIVNSKDRQDHGQQNETNDKLRTHNATLKIKAGVPRIHQLRLRSGDPER